MNPLPPSGRSALFDACLRTDFDPRLAEFFGFESGRESSSLARLVEGMAGKPESEQTSQIVRDSDEDSGVEEKTSTIYAAREPLKFLAEVNRIDLTEPAANGEVSGDEGDQISDEDLAVRNWDIPPTPPLVPWKRMMPFLKLRTGTTVPGRRIHRREMSRRLNSGQILTELPRVAFRHWSPKLVVLCDPTEEMWSFQDDISHIVERLRSECGEARLLFIESRFSNDSFLESLPPGSPVLALSAMGQLSQRSRVQQGWLCLGRRLAFRGHPLLAISPCPSDRFSQSLKRVWNPVVWDTGAPLPRFGSSPFRSSRVPPESMFDLESLLAPSSYVRRGLMRKARIAMGSAADVATEYDVWHGKRMHASTEVCNPLPAATTLCLRRRDQLREALPDLVSIMDKLIIEYHREAAVPIQVETLIRVGGRQSTSAEIVDALRPIIARLLHLAKNPGSSVGEATGLPEWLRNFQAQLSPSLREQADIASLLAEGLAAADEFEKNSGATLSEGTSEEAYMRARNRLRTTDLPIRTFEARLVGNSLRVEHTGLVFGKTEGFFIATIHARFQECLIGCKFGDEDYHATHIDLTADSNELVLVSMPDRVSFATDREVVDVESLVKPDWADTIAYSTEAPGGPESWNDEAPLWVESKAIAGHTMRFLHYETSKEADHRVGVDSSPAFWRHRPRGALSHFEFVSRDDFGFVAGLRLENVGFTFRWIPPGRFLMGSPEDEKGRYENEGPRHEVEITRGFWLGATQVTQAQWEVVMGENPSEDKGENRPVERVNWNEVIKYAESLNEKFPKLAVRLPSEAEWEYACRAGTTRAFGMEPCTEPDGRDPALEKRGWFADNTEYETNKVGLKNANEWGLFDMHGNVSEWCADGPMGYRKGRIVDPIEPAEDAYRVARGGGFPNFARDCRAASRYNFPHFNNHEFVGFRLAAGQPESEEKTG